MNTEGLLSDLMMRTQKRSAVKTIGLGIAQNVNESTCDIEQTYAPTLFDVRLNAVIDTLESYVTVIPKEGSYVLYGILENMEHEAAVLACSEVEKYIIKIGDTQQEITTEGTKINGGGENLKNVLNDLIAEIEKIIVVVGTSPNVPALEAIKLRLNKILT